MRRLRLTTKLESGAMDLVPEPCDLAALVDETQRVARGLGRRRGVITQPDPREETHG